MIFNTLNITTQHKLRKTMEIKSVFGIILSTLKLTDSGVKSDLFYALYSFYIHLLMFKLDSKVSSNIQYIKKMIN